MFKLPIILTLITLISCTNPESNTVEKEEAVKEDKKAAKHFPDGEFIKRYPTGGVQVKGQMLNNEREGLWTAYYKNSVKQSESTYQSGVLHGRTASFYSNGQVRYIGYFLGGEKDGKWDFYNEDGQFEKSELYVKGKLSKEK
jgi:antitoxin component YwqK of YwqJK toxin-antitoxin module